jgi:hypothetical protein
VVHHMPLHGGLRAMADLVRSGGTLFVLSLANNHTPGDWLYSGLGQPFDRILKRRYGFWKHNAPIADPEHSWAGPGDRAGRPARRPLAASPAVALLAHLDQAVSDCDRAGKAHPDLDQGRSAVARRPAGYFDLGVRTRATIELQLS